MSCTTPRAVQLQVWLGKQHASRWLLLFQQQEASCFQKLEWDPTTQLRLHASVGLMSPASIHFLGMHACALPGCASALLICVIAHSLCIRSRGVQTASIAPHSNCTRYTSAQPGTAVSRCQMLCNGDASIASWLQLRHCHLPCALLTQPSGRVSVHLWLQAHEWLWEALSNRLEACWLQVVRSGHCKHAPTQLV